MQSLDGSGIGSPSATQYVAAANEFQRKVPENMQNAILELIQNCKDKDVEIPELLGSKFLEALDSTRRQQAKSIMPFSVRVAADREDVKQHLSDSPLIREFHELVQRLQMKTPDLSLRIKDGYFKVIEHHDKSETKKDGKQRIETVYNGAPIQSLWKKLYRIATCTTKSATQTIERYPIKNVNLFFQQGKTYLVLGAPRSGKSTLLRLIAGILSNDKDHEVGGSVTINKLNPQSEGVVWSNFVGYIDQIDRLHPYLTVKETCEFAWNCRTGGTHKTPLMGDGPEIQAEIEKMDKEQTTIIAVLQAMGLTRVRDTFVGDQETVRGVSGGEKKRVTVSEMSVGGYPIMCMDEISTGLDAATTYDICKLLQEVNALRNHVKIVSLLQPPPETFSLFDELILLSGGQIIYSGPVQDVVPYFESLGYQLPERMDPADWLQAIPTKDGLQYLSNAAAETSKEEASLETQKHLTSEEFHTKFYESELGRQILEKVSKTFEPTENNAKLATEAVIKMMGQRFRNSSWDSLKLLSYRECLIWWRDKAGIKTRIAQDLIMGIIAGTVFWQQSDNSTSVLGILFQAMFFISVGAILKVPPQYAVRGILYKQQDANFFPTWSYVVGRSLSTIPPSVIDGLLFGTIVYWFVGLAWNDGASFGNYIMFVLITTMASIGIGLLFSIYSAITRDRAQGQAMISVTIVILVLFSGFTVQPSVIPKYWIWVYWINIFAWAYRGLTVNEYMSGKYDFESQVPGLTQGELVLTQLGFVDRNGQAYGFEWAGYSLLFSLLICLVSVVSASIFLNKVRFATGKSLANDSIEQEEDKNVEVKEVKTELPFQPVNLTFKDMHYTVTSSIGKEKIELLKGIDGVIAAGKMTALMGSSGAGKTTLMDVLSLRKSSGEITGEVQLNGHPQEELTFRRCTGYVEQFDVQSAQLTIRETCEFSAKLRLESSDPAVTDLSMSRFIDQTLEMLELTPIQDFLVGSDDSGGLSFEQRKRLSIAVELVANPSIIFLDEPTSGLDARAASIVCRGLKRIALSGRSICATIHQPSISIFNSFDTLLLLKRGGEVVFYGDLGENSKNLISYLQQYEATPLIQPGENPATWMLTTIGAGSAGGETFDYAGAYKSSELHLQALEKIDEIVKTSGKENAITFPSKYATSRYVQMLTVMKRTWKIYWRSPSYNRTRVITSAFLSLLIGSVYVSDRVPTSEPAMNSRVTTIYVSFLMMAILGMNTVLPFFEVERNMYYRHKASLMYDTPAISSAYTLAELPFLIGTGLLYTTIFYFMIGFEVDATKFFLYYLFMFLPMALFTYTGQMLVSVCPNAQIAQGFGGLISACTGLFTGVLIRPADIPNFWIFMYWLLPGQYVLESLLVTQYDGDDTPIVASPGTAFWNYLGCGTAAATTTCIGTAEEWVYATFDGNFVIENVPKNLAYLIGMIVLTRILTVFGLGYLNYRST
ncbi:ABC-2 type transporter-domain containing protein [Nitzschia inconspicua]|uniref:ABC-2 type transporter-domain containing protein n=1 Tax=Nitzschia inconspicua TaxID=303405 RepID=A0A9K3KVN3_9STRA|nr:ABC-2 type transporter-domain containing protein [Nitzschia inconspicua]